MNLEFEKLEVNKNAPMDLLLLADPSVALVREYLKNGKCFIAKSENETIGVVLIMETKMSHIEIMNIAVKEAFQNKGIGKQLLGFVIDEIKKTNAKSIEIGTGNSSMSQMMLYQKCGFRIVGIDFNFFRRHYAEKIFENGIECRDMIRLRMEIEQ